MEGPSTLRQAQGEREEWRPCEISDCIASFGIASPGFRLCILLKFSWNTDMRGEY